jgi:hypothetical protein
MGFGIRSVALHGNTPQQPERSEVRFSTLHQRRSHSHPHKRLASSSSSKNWKEQFTSQRSMDDSPVLSYSRSTYLHAPSLSCPVGNHARKKDMGSYPRGMDAEGAKKRPMRGSYKCGRCGLPKTGHICRVQPPTGESLRDWCGNSDSDSDREGSDLGSAVGKQGLPDSRRPAGKRGSSKQNHENDILGYKNVDKVTNALFLKG